MFKYLNIVLLAFTSFSCSRWDYEDKSVTLELEYPETYISIFSSDTIFTSMDSLGNISYSFSDSLNFDLVIDTLPNAFTTVTTSKQKIHWWAEDPDGNVVGYYYKWSSDTVWTFTNLENGLFYVPIRSDLDVFSFEVKAMDDDSLIDETPAKITLPIKIHLLKFHSAICQILLLQISLVIRAIPSQQKHLFGIFMTKMVMKQSQMSFILWTIHVHHVGHPSPVILQV